MQVRRGGLKSLPSFSGLAFPFPGEKICCLVGRKQFYPLIVATLDIQSMVSGVFRNDITSQTRLRIEHVSSSCPFTESQRDFIFFILFPPITQYCVMSLWKALVCIYKIWARFYMDI